MLPVVGKVEEYQDEYHDVSIELSEVLADRHSLAEPYHPTLFAAIEKGCHKDDGK
jgi:hypothetical protein